ncbi:MAG: hypothetical protein J7578_10500 [Chitinophagaceae bacterium]|nr:hypothetical protein [Chitinophagaceae bacterium]
MKKLKHIFPLLIPVLLTVAACKKDKGNYDYLQLSTYFVDSTSIPKQVVVKQNDQYNLAPVYTGQAADADLAYEWKLVTAGSVPDPVTGKFYEKQVGITKDLSYKVTETPGDYILVLYVSDKKHGGVTQMFKIPFNISSYASPGWMVLHGNSTECDISILVNNKVNTLVPAGTDYVQNNVFFETNGKKIEGEGAAISYMNNHWVDVFTKNNTGGYRVSGNDLRILNTYSDMFISPMPASDVQYQGYGVWVTNQLLVNKGDLYFTPQANPNGYNKYGVKCFGEDYYAAPFIGTIFNYSYYGVIYDAQNKRFLYIDFNRTVKKFKASGATAAFDMNNTGKEMVYAEHGFDSRWFCVMQNEGNTASRELFVSKFNVADDGNRAVARYDIHNGTDLPNAKYFAFGNRGNIMYYATDTKIYQSNYSGDLSSTLRLDISNNWPGYTITQMKLFKVTNHASDGRILFLGLYNAATSEGILLQMDVNEVSGVIDSIKAYPGFGKITGMGYKVK